MQVLEKNGSSGSTRTYNPPVNSAIPAYTPDKTKRNQIENIEECALLICPVLA